MQKGLPVIIRITASWFSIGFLLAACGRQSVADRRFTDVAISLRFPTDWSLANAASDSAAPERGVVYPGYESGTYYTCTASDRGYSDYVTSFTESIKPEDLPKLLGVLKTNGWEQCRTAAVDVYTKNDEILNVVTMTHTGNATVIVPWALRVLANEK